MTMSQGNETLGGSTNVSFVFSFVFIISVDLLYLRCFLWVKIPVLIRDCDLKTNGQWKLG
jgi:hypothetical protein